MRNLLPEYLTEVYALNEVTVIVHDVRSRELRDCAQALSFVSQWSRDSGDAEMLSELRAFSARVLFAFRNTPIPYEVLKEEKLSLRREEIFLMASNYAQAGGDALGQAVEKLRGGFERLSSLQNPLMNRYQEAVRDGGFDRCFIPRKHVLWGVDPEELGNLAKIPLRTFEPEAGIGGKACFFGQLMAYRFVMKDSFLLSPRFREIHLIGPNSSGEVERLVSEASLQFRKGKQQLKLIRVESRDPPLTDVQTGDDDCDSPEGGIPREMLDRLLRRFDEEDISRQQAIAGGEVAATAFLVANDKVLLLREGGHPKVLQLERPLHISAKAVSELEAGDIVLLRNESADVRAEFQDPLHDEWKAQLSMRIELGLADEIRDSLKRAGHSHTMVTIRNWCEASHGPEKRKTFEALMMCLDLDRIDERWATINAFREIGHEAGFSASEDLRNRFRKLDDAEIAQLKSGGLVEKRFGSGVGSQASMVAVTVEGVLARSLRAKQHLLGRIMPIPEDLLWLS